MTNEDPPQTPLAELWEAELDRETLRQLFADLGAVATVHELRIRRGPRYSGPAVDTDLSRARLLLESITSQAPSGDTTTSRPAHRRRRAHR